MARSDQNIDRNSDQSGAQAQPRVRAHRPRWTWITVLAVGLISGSALLAVPAIAADGAPVPADRVIVCESGVVDQGDIQTSSASAERVSADAPVPDGCRER